MNTTNLPNDQQPMPNRDQIAQPTTSSSQTPNGAISDQDLYPVLFNAIDEGFFLCDVLVDEADQPIDLLYVDANPAATKMVGSDFRDRRLREIDPTYEEYGYAIFGHTARTGEPQRLERYAAPDNRWYSFYIFKIGDQTSRRIANIFQDISERKQAELVLRYRAKPAQPAPTQRST